MSSSIGCKVSFLLLCGEPLRTPGLMAIPTMIVSLLFVPLLLTLVFGAKRVLTGTMEQMLGVAYFLRFVFSPLSYNYCLAERHSEDLLLQCMSLGLTVATFLVVRNAGLDLLETLVVYCAICACIYLIYGARSMCFAWESRSNQQISME